jgi:GcrA cell cycle regulator
MNQHQTPWTAERDAQLRSLWDAGISGTEIGKRMGITKSAAIGRVHRLKLAPRVSPIATITKAWTEEEDARLRQLYGGFLSVDQIGQKLDRSPASIRYRAVHLGLVSKKGSAEHRARLSGALRKGTPQVQRAARTSAVSSPARGGRASFPPPAPDLPGVAPETLQQRRVFSNRQCKAPLGGRGEFRFCDAPVIENAKGCASPYCLEHYAAFYIGTNASMGPPGLARWA